MNDETLILYYYGDGLSERERAAVEAALESDPSTRERYRALRESLDAFDDPPATRASPDAVARWHGGVEHAAAGEGGARGSAGTGWHFPSFAWGALAAALVAAAGVALYLGGRAAPDPPVAERRDAIGADAPVSTAPEARPVSFSRGVEFHLRESRRDILRLAPGGNGERTLLIMDILRQNRLFERAAREHEAEDIARVLRAFEPVLLRLAREDTSTEDADALRAKLLFELDVVLTKMQQEESDATDSI